MGLSKTLADRDPSAGTARACGLLLVYHAREPTLAVGLAWLALAGWLALAVFEFSKPGARERTL